jgi:hypothetical protein
MSHKLNGALAVISIDISARTRSTSSATTDVVQLWCGRNGRTAKWKRGSPTCHLLDRDGSLRRRPSSQSQAAGLVHDARLMPAKYVRPYSKGQKNDFPEAALLPARSSARTQHNGVLAHERTLPLQTRAGGSSQIT